MHFEPITADTIGMEMEFQILEKNDKDLSYRAQEVLERFSDDEHVKPEYQNNTIEVTSGICQSMEELRTDMAKRIVPVIAACDELETMLCGSGTHPFSTALAIITPLPRYLGFKKREGYLSRVQITFANHVHLGMPDGDTAIRVMRELKAYLPLLVALSASSPFWRGHDTEFASYRHRILAATRSYGIPPSFSGWDEFCAFFDTMHRAQAYSTVNDIHWDIRPRPHLGSLEVRVMDAQSTVNRATALACLVRCIVRYLKHTTAADRSLRLPAPLHWWMEKENHYQASHLGLSARFIKDEDGNVTRLSQVFDNVLTEIDPVIDRQDEGHHIDYLRSMAQDGPEYERQRRLYESTRSFPDILTRLNSELVEELEAITAR